LAIGRKRVGSEGFIGKNGREAGKKGSELALRQGGKKQRKKKEIPQGKRPWEGSASPQKGRLAHGKKGKEEVAGGERGKRLGGPVQKSVSSRNPGGGNNQKKNKIPKFQKGNAAGGIAGPGGGDEKDHSPQSAFAKGGRKGDRRRERKD